MSTENVTAFVMPRPQTAALPERYLPIREVLQIVPYSRMHIDRLEKRGEFPARVRIGPARVAWKLSEVLAWADSKRRPT